MNTIEDEIRRQIRVRGLDAHVADRSLHLEAAIYERLSGAVDGSNRIFRSTYLPDPAEPVELEFRGLIREDGGTDDGDFVNDGYGRVFMMNVAPKTDSFQVDRAPRVRYRRLFVPIVELDSDTIPAMLRRRRPAFVMPVPRRRPSGAGVVI